MCAIALMHVGLQINRRVLYLEGFKEASSACSGPVLQLFIVCTQTHHGLAVDVQLLVQSLQQG